MWVFLVVHVPPFHNSKSFPHLFRKKTETKYLIYLQRPARYCRQNVFVVVRMEKRAEKDNFGKFFCQTTNFISILTLLTINRTPVELEEGETWYCRLQLSNYFVMSLYLVFSFFSLCFHRIFFGVTRPTEQKIIYYI